MKKDNQHGKGEEIMESLPASLSPGGGKERRKAMEKNDRSPPSTDPDVERKKEGWGKVVFIL